MNDSRALPAEMDFAPSKEASWLGRQLGRPNDVASLVPAGYEAYARVLHPAGLRVGRSLEKRDVPWQAVAERLGTVTHASMEWASITGDWRYLTSNGIPDLWTDPPRTGQLPTTQLSELASVLQRHSAEPVTYFGCVWVGYNDARFKKHTDTIEIARREVVVVHGSLSALISLGSTVGLQWWWPSSRLWCVSTDIDLPSTLVGASQLCIRELLEQSNLEVWPVTSDQDISWRADTVNPRPSGAPEDPHG